MLVVRAAPRRHSRESLLHRFETPVERVDQGLLGRQRNKYQSYLYVPGERATIEAPGKCLTAVAQFCLDRCGVLRGARLVQTRSLAVVRQQNGNDNALEDVVE